MAQSDETLREFSNPESFGLSIEEVLRAVMNEFGGPVGYARQLKADFNALAPGNPSRVRISTTILQCVQRYGGDEIADAEDLESIEAHAKRIQELIDDEPDEEL